MPPADQFQLFLLVKMISTAAIVVTASWIAERTGPLLAALIATLPISAGPVYVFLAIEHGDAFIAQAALGSMAANLGTAGFAAVYVMIGSRLPTLLALGVSLAAHLALLALFRSVELGFAELLALTLGVYAVLHLLVRIRLRATPKARPRLAWHALPLRALLVALLVAGVTSVSATIGSRWSGLLATFPVVLSTLVLFLQPRLGGPATAAILASGMLGLMGFGVGLAALHLTAEPLGRWPALALGLAVCLLWNLAIGLHARLRA